MTEADGAVPAGEAPPHPFVRVVEGDVATLVIEVRDRNEATFRTSGKARIEGLDVAAKGAVRRGPDGTWRLAAFEGAGPSGRTLAGTVGELPLEGFREAVLAQVAAHLGRNERMLLEAELVSIFRSRKVREDAIASVRAEIERRKGKVRALTRERDRELSATREREASIRSRLADLAASDRIVPGVGETGHQGG